MSRALQLAIGMWILMALGFVTTSVVAGPEDDPIGRQLQSLADRIRRVELSLGMRDGETLAPAILNRLRQHDDGLAEIERRFEDAGTGLAERQLEDMQRQLKKAQADAKDLESRLLTLETGKSGQEDLSRELRQLGSEMRSVQSSLAAIQQRLAKLESK